MIANLLGIIKSKRTISLIHLIQLHKVQHESHKEKMMIE
jgi:hypothetical protein